MIVTFHTIGINGEGIGKYKQKTVFCDGVLPGETAEVEIIARYPRYFKAKCLKILKKSAYRKKPICPYYKQCGGCSFMHIREEAQAIYKKTLLIEALEKYGNVHAHFVRDLRTSEQTLHYRSACKLPVRMEKGKLVTGMYQPGTNHFVPIPHCMIHSEELESLRIKVLDTLNNHGINAYDTKTKTGLRYLVLRSIYGKGQCTLVTGDDTLPKTLINALFEVDGLDSLYQSINTKKNTPDVFGNQNRKLGGSDHISFMIDDVQLSLGNQSFFQLNVEQAIALYRTAVSKIDTCNHLLEAYCGIGAMSLLAHNKAKHITGIELSKQAIQNATENAKQNGWQSQYSFMVGDATKQYATLHHKHTINAVLVDPPRTGLTPAFIETLATNPPEKLIYVSCNPATLGKDLKQLKHFYQVRTVIPFDLFPQTPLVEAIVVLSLH